MNVAGGRMIGKKMCELTLDGAELNFYKWEGDVKVFMIFVFVYSCIYIYIYVYIYR
jgi:hypothetical protein